MTISSMRPVYYRFLIYLMFAIIAISTIPSCKKKSESTMLDSADSGYVDKEKIKAFWDLYRSGQKHRIAKEFIPARDDYRKALEINPRHQDALFNLGNMCYELGEYADAEQAWNRLIEVHSLNARAHYQLGNLYLRIDIPGYFNLDKSAEEFNKALDLNREITGPLLHLGQIFLIKNKLDEADRYFSNVTGTDKKNVEGYFQQGYIAWKKNQTESAMQLFSNAVNYAVPEKRIAEVLIEGDTRNGQSLKRPSNQSIFYNYFQGLNGLNENSIHDEMLKRFSGQDLFLLQIRKRIQK